MPILKVSESEKHNNDQHKSVPGSSIKESKETNGYDPLIYNHNGKKLIFKRTSYDYKLICPNCLKETKQMIQHISKGKCSNTVNMDDFKRQLKNYKKSYTKENNIKKQKAWIKEFLMK